jgi:membrane protease YdiL (CAAX protease family)
MISRSLQWRKWIARCPTCGLYLVALLAACFSLMRAVAVFGPPQLQVLLPLSFTLMAITPWIVLSRFGRDQIGLRRARSISSYAKAVFAGVLLALVCGVMGSLLFEVGEQNWFVTIARNFGRSFDTGGKSTFLLFAVFTVPSMIFSPIGEEFFFRALLQRSLEDFTSRSLATVCECSVFAIVHLCHHGLYRTSMGFSFWMPSSIIWAALMFLAGYLFAYFRNTSDSIFPAVVCHMAFNATMGVYIFSVLWGAHHAA